MNNKITKSILLCQEAMELVAKYEVKNLSKLVEDLIIDNLQDKDWWASQAAKHIAEAQRIEDKHLKRGLTLQWVRL